MSTSKPIDPRRIERPDPEMVRVLRQKSGAERLQITAEMVASARRMLHASLSHRHPDWTDEEVRAEVARRIALGD